MDTAVIVDTEPIIKVPIMPENSGPNHNSYSVPTTPEPPLQPPQTLLSRVRAQFATLRPWREVVSPSSFSFPYSYATAMSRVRRNICYFRMNYALVMLLILFCRLIYHPFSMITFLVIFIAWILLRFFRDDPVIGFGRILDDRFVMICLSLITVVALVLTDLGLNVLFALIIGVVVVGLHGAFRVVEDLFLDEF